MWNKIQYALIYSWVKVHALLPMWALYILSDILYVLVYKVVRYRVKVVRQNMKASFPDKSDWFESAGLSNPDIIKLNVNREPRFYAWVC